MYVKTLFVVVVGVGCGWVWLGVGWLVGVGCVSEAVANQSCRKDVFFLWTPLTMARSFSYPRSRSPLRCCALLCIVVQVVGLGDRHLDNILIDLKTGNLLHVDLSVAFGKGLYGLRVPEVVPFRLSPAMLGPLGLGRLNGTSMFWAV